MQINAIIFFFFTGDYLMRRGKVFRTNPLVTGNGPVTGRQYLKIQEKLGLSLSAFLSLLGANMRDHYVIQRALDEPVADVGLAMHLRLLDRYPELVEPPATVDQLTMRIREIAREAGDLTLPMRISPSFIALILGRNPRNSSMWNTGKTGPTWKVAELMKDFLTLLDNHAEPARFLDEYLEQVTIEATARGEPALFAHKKWPPSTEDRPDGEPADDG